MQTDRGGAMLFGVCIRNGISCLNRISLFQRRYLTEVLHLGKHLDLESMGCELGLDQPFIQWRDRTTAGPDDGNSVWNAGEFTPNDPTELSLEGPERWLEVNTDDMPEDEMDSIEVVADVDLTDSERATLNGYVFNGSGFLIKTKEAEDPDEDEPHTILKQHHKLAPRSYRSGCVEFIWGRWRKAKKSGRWYWSWGSAVTSLLPVYLLMKRRWNWWPMKDISDKFEGKKIWMPGLYRYYEASNWLVENPTIEILKKGTTVDFHTAPNLDRVEGAILVKAMTVILRRRTAIDKAEAKLGKEVSGF